MRVVFMGTPEFAVPSLRALARDHDVLAAYTRPDRPSGRGRRQTPPAVKTAALDLGVEVRQPPSLTEDGVREALSALSPDVLCVAAYGLLLPQDVLDVAPHGGLNVHASLLPRWRGAAPVQRAILAGDEMTGVSIMRMVAALDAGPCAAQEALPITPEDDATRLTEALAALGSRMLLEVLAGIEHGTAAWTEQDDSLATYAHKVSADELRVHPGLDAQDATRRVRASTPGCPSRTAVAGIDVILLAVDPVASDLAPGEVRQGRGELLLGCCEGALRVLACKPAGRGVMEGPAFARGLRLTGGETWGAQG